MNFLKKIKEYIEFYKQKFSSSKYVIKGKCKRCGNCCRNIVFVIGDSYVKTEAEFARLKEFKKIYHHFFISGTDEDGALLFTCKSLEGNLCRDYKVRSLFCRNYPQIIPKFIYGGGTTLDNCGHCFDVNKKFNDFLSDPPCNKDKTDI